MLKTGHIGLLLFLWLAASGPARALASTLSVEADGTGDYVTIQAALDAAEPGDTLLVGAGVYAERLRFPRSGSVEKGPISLRNKPGASPILDGETLDVGEGWDPLLRIENREHVAVEGFEIRNMRTSSENHVPIGVLVTGYATKVELRRLTIHHVENTYDPGGSAVQGSDAHGLAVYGTDPARAISSLVLQDIEIRDCKLGSSEALVLNGNVDGFTVSNCRIHDNNNIGIDFIGHEGVCPDPAVDQARNGLCADNRVYNISTSGNPAYRRGGGEFDLSAGGIYVDGGRDIVIERNVVHHCNIGLEVASEHAGKLTTNIVARNNFLYLNDIGGFFIGGYGRNRGAATNCAFVNNTLYKNDTRHEWNGEILLQYRVENCTFKNNIIYTAPDGDDAVFVGGTGDGQSAPSNIRFDHNLFFATPAAANNLWIVGASEYTDFAAWKAGGNGQHSILGADPLLASPESGDPHIAPLSPARDAGDATVDAGILDLDRQPRKSDGKVDIGADEMHKSASAPLIWIK